uniref:Uncharacterized protein n=1 Tax=Porodaedalea pini TaxID=108901 RepID=A0A5B9RJF8_9AGAM|nr:hypothetical protein PPIT_000054 [Porodaedalea pini]QEG56935.1 hypothetical protein PPIT_000054 [Porodaedalea pini]
MKTKMTLILIYLLSIILFVNIGLFALSTVVFIILSYLGYDFILPDLFYHLFWLSLLFYSLFTLSIVVTKLQFLFTSIINKDERKYFIGDIKYQIRCEIEWIKTNIISQILIQIFIFTKNVANILFKWIFRQ